MAACGRGDADAEGAVIGHRSLAGRDSIVEDRNQCTCLRGAQNGEAAQIGNAIDSGDARVRRDTADGRRCQRGQQRTGLHHTIGKGDLLDTHQDVSAIGADGVSDTQSRNQTNNALTGQKCLLCAGQCSRIERDGCDGVVRGEARIRRGIAPGPSQNDVVARTAGQSVGAACTRDQVVACAAQQRVAGITALQTVVEAAADDDLDGAYGVGRTSMGNRSGRQIGVDAAGAARVDGGVSSCPAVDDVGASATFQHVIATAATKGIVAGAPDQAVVGPIALYDVIAQAAENGLDVVHITGAIARARKGARCKIHRNLRRALKIHGIETGTAIELAAASAHHQDVVARATEQRIVAAHTVQHVVGCIAGDVVVKI